MSRLIDLTGRTFGRLTVIRKAGRSKTGTMKWLCKCECGNESITRSDNLRNGRAQSCGCLRREVPSKHLGTHFMTGTKIYNIWVHMRNRCSNPQNQAYKNYGARGITVCERWQIFDNFYLDMGDRPGGMSLERIDNDKGYSPGNCKWATTKEQHRNTRRNRIIEYDGRKQCLSEWADDVGMSSSVLHNRLVQKKWTVERAFTQEVRI